MNKSTSQPKDTLNVDSLVLGVNPSFMELIRQALSKLPKDVFDKVDKECLFITPLFIDDANGCYIPNEMIKARSLILLSENYFLNGKREDLIETILHEIAHHILGHKLISSLSEKEIESNDTEACKLTEFWLKKNEM